MGELNRVRKRKVHVKKNVLIYSLNNSMESKDPFIAAPGIGGSAMVFIQK